MTPIRVNGIRRRRVVGLLTLAALPPLATARNAPPEVAGDLPDARLRGSGRLTFLTLHVYDIRLWSPAVVPRDDASQTPLALEIEYARKLYGREIAKRSLEEMRGIGTVGEDQGARWLATMTELFPDVARGDRITGVQRPGGVSRFFLNGRLLGEVADPAFTRLFFGIWLSPKTSEPKLRLSLLGETGSGS